MKEIDRMEAQTKADKAQEIAAAIRVVANQAQQLANECEDAGWDFAMDFAAGVAQLEDARRYFETWDRTHATDCGVKTL